MSQISAANDDHHASQDIRQGNTTSTSLVKDLWQNPYVDVFKYFHVAPTPDWSANKKEGDVREVTAHEIGRKAYFLNGNLPSNNYLQIPSPTGLLKTLGLNGRYLYLMAKTPSSASPFSFHFDLQMAEQTTGIRISASNLYKQISVQNGFVIQVPLNLDQDRWTVSVFDIYDLL